MTAILAAMLAVSAILPARAQDSAEWDARLGEVSGEVMVVPADGSGEAAGEEGAILMAGDRIVVGEGGSAEVALDGGSLITLREGADLKIESASRADAGFFLAAGSLLAKIQKLAEARFKVRTPSAVAAVRGTEFGVDVEGEDTHVGVFDEGKVEVSAGGGMETLVSNQETKVVKGARPVAPFMLGRFVARRAQMRAHARRIAAIRRRWKNIPPEQRLELRRKALERMRERRAKMIERIKERQSKKERAADDRRRRASENREKMERRRRAVERRRP